MKKNEPHPDAQGSEWLPDSVWIEQADRERKPLAILLAYRLRVAHDVYHYLEHLHRGLERRDTQNLGDFATIKFLVGESRAQIEKMNLPNDERASDLGSKLRRIEELIGHIHARSNWQTDDINSLRYLLQELRKRDDAGVEWYSCEDVGFNAVNEIASARSEEYGCDDCEEVGQ